MIRLVLAAGLLAGLGGCADLGPILEQLRQDPNAVCVRVTSVWVSATLDRLWGCEQPRSPP